MANKRRIRLLLKAYIAGTISRKDFDELHDYIASDPADGELAMFMNEVLLALEPDDKAAVDSEKIYRQIINNQQFIASAEWTAKHHKPVYFLFRTWLGRIAVVFCIGAALFLYQKYRLPASPVAEQPKIGKTIGNNAENDVKRAILRLADGTVIDLDSVQNGLLATQGNTQVMLKGDELSYTALKDTSDVNPTLNTIITPKGRQYRIVLPDGTKVWLNAATTLTYPVYFKGDKRLVELAGEAYFEVSQDNKKPFIVKSVLQEVEVLGTSFNISAYKDDESTKTTLVDGKVRVNRQLANGIRSSALLSPGQQAIVAINGNSVGTLSVDMEETISWKTGLFVFNNEEVNEVMKKVSRWYDIEVAYQDGMEGKRIGGSIPQFKDINKLMQSLQNTGLLHYKMEGGKIIIMK